MVTDPPLPLIAIRPSSIIIALVKLFFVPIKILSNAKRISFADEQSQQLEGDRMMYDLEKKSWVLLKKDNQNDKIEINKRVKTILKTLKKNTDE